MANQLLQNGAPQYSTRSSTVLFIVVFELEAEKKAIENLELEWARTKIK